VVVVTIQAAGPGAWVEPPVTSDPLQFYGQDFLPTAVGDWLTPVTAAIAADSVNAALVTAQFVDALNSAVGFQAFVPTTAAMLDLTIISRAEVAPGAPSGPAVRLDTRVVRSNAAVGPWTTSASPVVPIPANAFWQYSNLQQSLALSSLVPGRVHQFQLVRTAPDALAGQWNVLAVLIGFR
jgi:hypothetical protein